MHSPNGLSFVARLDMADIGAAQHIADMLTEMLDPDRTAVALFERPDGGWTVQAHFDAAPDGSLRDLIERIAGVEAARALHFESVQKQDWVAASLADLKPVRAGRFMVHGRHDRARVPPNVIGIEIEAALAFGTGHHGTTRGCLLALEALVKQQRRRKRGRASSAPPPYGEVGARRQAGAGWGSLGDTRASQQLPPSPTLPHKGGGSAQQTGQARRTFKQDGRKKILDVGTGTGVLAIAAAKALRSNGVLASDIDIAAIRVACANAQANRVGPFVVFVHAPGVDRRHFRTRGPYDLIFANILLGPLKALARPIGRLLARRGRVILSGLLEAQANAALCAYRAQGLRLERRITLEGWTTLVLARG
jgi:ribosomal protein L11 methyltransferase